MGLCFICDTKLYGERTRVCSSMTQHTNIPYPEKIAEILGEDFVIICTPADHMCKKCTSLLTHFDKLENEMKLVKNAMVSYIQKKYGLLPHDQAIKDVEIVNGHLKTEEQQEQEQKKVPSVLTVRENATVTTAAIGTPILTPLKLLKPIQHHQLQKQLMQIQQPQQKQQPLQKPQLLLKQHPLQKQQTLQKQLPMQRQQQPHHDGGKLKIYKCGFCTFQSKELGHVRFHMRTHANKKEAEKPIGNQAAAKALTPTAPPQKKRLYRCQVCSKSFDSRINCLDHIQKDHNQPTASTSNGRKRTEDSCLGSSKVTKPVLSQENNHVGESSMNLDDDQQDNNKGTVDTDLMLNDNVPQDEGADIEQEEETKNSGEGAETENFQQDKAVKSIKPEPVQEEEEEEEEDGDVSSISKQEEADQETSDNVEIEVHEETANVENKTGDLDIESMLAAIHNDNPTSSSTQDKD